MFDKINFIQNTDFKCWNLIIKEHYFVVPLKSSKTLKVLEVIVQCLSLT